MSNVSLTLMKGDDTLKTNTIAVNFNSNSKVNLPKGKAEYTLQRIVDIQQALSKGFIIKFVDENGKTLDGKDTLQKAAKVIMDNRSAKMNCIVRFFYNLFSQENKNLENLVKQINSFDNYSNEYKSQTLGLFANHVRNAGNLLASMSEQTNNSAATPQPNASTTTATTPQPNASTTTPQPNLVKETVVQTSATSAQPNTEVTAGNPATTPAPKADAPVFVMDPTSDLPEDVQRYIFKANAEVVQNAIDNTAKIPLKKVFYQFYLGEQLFQSMESYSATRISKKPEAAGEKSAATKTETEKLSFWSDFAKKGAKKSEGKPAATTAQPKAEVNATKQQKKPLIVMELEGNQSKKVQTLKVDPLTKEDERIAKGILDEVSVKSRKIKASNAKPLIVMELEGKLGTKIQTSNVDPLTEEDEQITKQILDGVTARIFVAKENKVDPKMLSTKAGAFKGQADLVADHMKPWKRLGRWVNGSKKDKSATAQPKAQAVKVEPKVEVTQPEAPVNTGAKPEGEKK